LARRLGGVLRGDPEVEITGVAGVIEAIEGDLTFLASPRYEAAARRTRASAVLVGTNHHRLETPTIEIADPYRAFLEAVKLFRPAETPEVAGVHPTALVGPGVELGEEVSIGAHAVLDAGVAVGDRTVIGPLA
jgi:UDP-3-O-[3-hydroxymyristoyl] glucosamine N-acyltransferase